VFATCLYPGVTEICAFSADYGKTHLRSKEKLCMGASTLGNILGLTSEVSKSFHWVSRSRNLFSPQVRLAFLVVFSSM
jgi:hypothetical protein